MSIIWTNWTNGRIAVVHERVTPHVHNVREEVVTRETHTYDVIHRVQPVVDVEVLPTKHFVHNLDGTLREISEAEIPGRVGNWHVAAGPAPAPVDHSSTASKSAVPLRSSSLAATQSIAPVQVSYVEETSADGVLRSVTTWKHPPQYDQRDAGSWSKTAYEQPVTATTIADQHTEAATKVVPVRAPETEPESDSSEHDYHDARDQVESPVRHSVNYDRLSSESTTSNPTFHDTSHGSQSSGISKVMGRAKDVGRKAKDRLSGRLGHSRESSGGIDARMKELNIQEYSGKLSIEKTPHGTRVTSQPQSGSPHG
ncbi:hypothetical protein EJ05DRAFT_230312 [Pseudovirgaria hyperparasitica]|uniref:Uncharacterized protein n=1 Tax=Pseudovirgaria hyperparasitica TaxID=470096 RepID=A0A6A6VUS7_9PEZI|nr:uncharacterized protein EJ05DRAFT_230312 [Pseudovirgaria hyperparasitica]KAF2753017.1 hypothetical protein EJ05DRAFT_230312 [Pseudovirgaria hyperparasitica]